MNKMIPTLAIVLAFPLAAAAFPGGGPGPDGHHGRRMERMTKELNLTDEQKTRVETLFKEQHENYKAIHDETQAKLGEILTPEQMTKMEEVKKQHREKWHQKRTIEKPE
ncbi:MAG: periplasmic heavy metal sensor [Gammaproteobacteria bacterium]